MTAREFVSHVPLSQIPKAKHPDSHIVAVSLRFPKATSAGRKLRLYWRERRRRWEAHSSHDPKISGRTYAYARDHRNGKVPLPPVTAAGGLRQRAHALDTRSRGFTPGGAGA